MRLPSLPYPEFLRHLFLNNSHLRHRFFFLNYLQPIWDFSGGSEGKASVYSAGDLGSIPRLGSFPGEGNGNPLQYSCLENPMEGGAWRAAVHGVSKSRTWLSDFTFTFNQSGYNSWNHFSQYINMYPVIIRKKEKVTNIDTDK